MKTQSSPVLPSTNKGNQFDSLLSFVALCMDNQIGRNQGVNILEIGSDALLTRPHLKAAIRFDHSKSRNADIICDENLLPFSANYDLIISPLSLHFAKSPKTHLNQLISVLKPGGQLVLTTFGHYSLHEIRASQIENLDLIEFIHPSQLKSWLPPQGEREIQEDWIILNYDRFLDFIEDTQTLNISPFIKSTAPLTHERIPPINEQFDGSLTFQIITLRYKKPHFMRDE